MKNNLTITILLSTLSIFAMSTLDLSYGQENITYSDEPKFFAILHAQSGSISEINATAYTLELNDVSDKTILFSDRPDRIVTSVSTSVFIGNWSVGEDSFVVDPPNAILVVDEMEKQDGVIVELFNPVYHSQKKTLKYDIIPDNTTSIDLSQEFSQNTLTIDPGCITDPPC